MEKEIKLITEQTEELLKMLGVTAELSVKAEEEAFNVFIDSKDDNALLIGKHGNTLSSLELVLSLIVANKLGEYKRIIVEIGGYRQEREEYLRDLANRLRQEVVDSGYEKTIRGLKPWERRSIHLLLQEDSEVTTESQGEGKDRVLIIKKK